MKLERSGVKLNIVVFHGTNLPYILEIIVKELKLTSDSFKPILTALNIFDLFQGKTISITKDKITNAFKELTGNIY